jgi:prepilin-type N-terminal cleavage/methylation domain-containing protein
MQIPTPSRTAIKRDGDRRARGFTLVELLVVLTVMVALGGMLTYALASATTEARIKRTQADVLTIGQLLQSRMNEVSLGPVPLVYSDSQASTPGVGGMSSNGSNSSIQARDRSRLILAARRDLIRMVLPECRADLLFPPATLQYRYLAGGQWQVGAAQVRAPAQWNRMRTLAGLYSGASIDAFFSGNNPVTDPAVDGIQRAYNGGFQAPFHRFEKDFYDQAGGSSVPDFVDDDASVAGDRFWSRENESAECLYLILATTQLFGKKAIDQIPSSGIGDTDGDGFLEILDSWGNPYEFIRNPAGLDNPAIKNFDPSGANLAEQYPSDPDPLDFLLADFRYEAVNFPSSPASLAPFQPFYLPPVVISAGQDGDFGIRRTFWLDGGVANGVEDYYSASNVIIGNNIPGPNLLMRPNNPPRFNGPAPYRYPDPFVDVTAGGNGSAYVFTPEGIRTAREGGGLGATLDRGQTADNITSLDADI